MWRGILGEQTAMVIIGMIFSSIGTVLVQWMRRDKTESEAEVNEAQADIFKANALVTLYETVAKMAQDIQKQAAATIEQIEKYDTCKQEITRMKGREYQYSRQEKQWVEQINILESQVAELMQSKIDLEAQVAELLQSKFDMEKSNAEKDGQITALEDKMGRWRKERDADRKRITTLETERIDLLATVADLSTRLEAKEKQTGNGKTDKKDTQDVEIVAETEEKESVDDKKTILD